MLTSIADDHYILFFEREFAHGSKGAYLSPEIATLKKSMIGFDERCHAEALEAYVQWPLPAILRVPQNDTHR